MSEENQKAAPAEGQVTNQSEAEAKPTAPQPTKVSPPGVFDGKEERLYAGKYRSADDLEKAYLEAQKVIGKKQEVSQSSKGIDYEEFGKQFRAALEGSGEMPAEMQAFSKGAGYGREHYQEQRAQARAELRAKATETLGLDYKDEQWMAVNNWLLDTKTQEDIDALNVALERGYFGALKDVLDQFQKAQGQDQPPVKVGTSPKDGNVQAGGFKDAAEARAWLKEKKGLRNPSDLDEWMRRLSASSPTVKAQMGASPGAGPAFG